MRAINRTNRFGLTFCFVEQPDGKTRIHLLGDAAKRITVDASIEKVEQAWFNWITGTIVSDAFFFLNRDEREFLMTGITVEKWNEVFSEKEN